MVNIIAIVSITASTIETFKGFDHYWTTCLNIVSSQREKDKLIRYKQILDAGAHAIAQEYRLASRDTKNVGILFGTIERAKMELADFETRALICSPESTIVLQKRSLPDKYTNIITVNHRTVTKIITIDLDDVAPKLHPRKTSSED